MSKEQTTNSTIVKNAATRMCAYLKGKGVSVKRCDMLEALANGFDADNFRKLKAVLDAPRVPPKKSKPLGQEQTWTVHALYLENDQQFGDYYGGRMPLEAVYMAMAERLTDCGLEIAVTEVLNEDGECLLSPSFIHENEMEPHRKVLAQLLAAQPKDDAEQPDLRAAQAWLKAVLAEHPEADDLKDLTDYDLWEKSLGTPEGCIAGSTTLSPSKALELLAQAAESSQPTLALLEQKHEKLAKACYQVRALVAYFPTLLDSQQYGLCDYELDEAKAN